MILPEVEAVHHCPLVKYASFICGPPVWIFPSEPFPVHFSSSSMSLFLSLTPPSPSGLGSEA